jgi:hypothetical protein
MEAADKWWQDPGYPCLFAWCMSARSDDGTRYTYSRNPYFWRVDTEGNQLPYIDHIDVEIVSDEQVRLLNVSQGKYDTAFRVVGNPNDIPFLEEQAAAGGYHLMEGWMNGAGAWPGYMVNQYYVEGGKNYANDTPRKPLKSANCCATSASARPSRSASTASASSTSPGAALVTQELHPEPAVLALCFAGRPAGLPGMGLELHCKL